MADQPWSLRPPQCVLLATDLSSRCDRALDRAAHLANLWGARLVVLNVIAPVDPRRMEDLEDMPSWRRPLDPARAAAAQVRRDLGDRLPAVNVRVAEGDPVAAIEAVAEEEGAELIVTGVARDETLGRYILGSTVERLARRTPIPLLVVKSRLRLYEEVLVATDFSPSSQHALTAAATFFPGARLSLLHGWEAPFPGFLDNPAFREDWRRQQEQAGTTFVAGAPISPAQREAIQVLIEHGCPEVLTRAYMQDNGVDLVVVGTHGLGAVFDRPLGGTAKRILEFAPGDVMLVREPRAVKGDH